MLVLGVLLFIAAAGGVAVAAKTVLSPDCQAARSVAELEDVATPILDVEPTRHWDGCAYGHPSVTYDLRGPSAADVRQLFVEHGWSPHGPALLTSPDGEFWINYYRTRYHQYPKVTTEVAVARTTG